MKPSLFFGFSMQIIKCLHTKYKVGISFFTFVCNPSLHLLKISKWCIFWRRFQWHFLNFLQKLFKVCMGNKKLKLHSLHLFAITFFTRSLWRSVVFLMLNPMFLFVVICGYYWKCIYCQWQVHYLLRSLVITRFSRSLWRRVKFFLYWIQWYFLLNLRTIIENLHTNKMKCVEKNTGKNQLHKLSHENWFHQISQGKSKNFLLLSTLIIFW